MKWIMDPVCGHNGGPWPLKIITISHLGWLVNFKSKQEWGQMKAFRYRNCCSKRIFPKNHYFGRYVLALKKHISETSRNWTELKKYDKKLFHET